MRFTIPMIPVGQMRARHTARRTKKGKIFSQTYKDEKQAAREQTLQAFLVEHVPPTPLTGAIALGVRCYMPIPKSKPRKWQVDAQAGFIRPTTKPDLDNCIKHLKDCLTQMRFWEDDKQVVEYMPGTGMYYSISPRWVVEIQEV